MGATANFAQTPRSENASVATANANRDGTGTIVSVFTTGASGSRVDRIDVKAVSSTTAGVVRAFKKEGAGAWKLWREYVVSAATPSASVASFATRDDDIAEVLKTGVQIGVSTHNAEAFEVFVGGGDF